MGKALYRKYRPLKLDDVVGQDSVISSLKNSLKQGKISHAYLFTGPRGCGKTSVARIFAHDINQFKYELEDNYVDIIEIDAASNRGIEDIRELREKAFIAPTEGKYKVYIMDEAHMLTREAANAFLKILEEPPAHVVFIMATTNPEKLPITITSRAVIYNFSLAPTATMTAHLQKIAKVEKISITDDALAIIIQRGGGSFRDSISLLDQLSTLTDQTLTAELVEQALGLPQTQLVRDLLQSFTTGDANAITTALATAINGGVKEEALVEALLTEITADPRPELLPLLAKLPSVTAPFITAKLLTAFLGEGTPSVATPILSRDAFAAHAVAGPRHSVSAVPPPSPSKEGPSLPQPTFSWGDFLTRLEPSATASIMNSLTSCQHLFTDGTLHLYPKKFGERILNSPNNKAVLLDALGPIQLVIHSAKDTPPEPASPPTLTAPDSPTKSPDINQIFGIMDKTQEVKYAGEVPFD